MEYLKNENIFNCMPEGLKKMGFGVRMDWNRWHMRKRAVWEGMKNSKVRGP